LEDRRLLSIFMVTGTGDAHLAGDMFANPVSGHTDTYSLPSLRAAVEAANQNTDNDTIEFDPSLANKTISLQIGRLELSDTTGATTITGLGTNQSTVSGNNAWCVFYVDSGVTAQVSGLTISGGYANGAGGGISNSGTLTITSSVLSLNAGGGISNSGTLIVTNSTISGNHGGGISSSGTLTVTNSTISGNSDNGGISNSGTGTLTVTDSTFSGNSANENGGGISNGGTLAVTNSTFSGNSATGYNGGGIYNGGTLTVTNSTFSGNSAHEGSGMWIIVCAGGIYNGGTLTVTNSTFSGNSADDGGSIYNNYNGTLTVNDGTISGNSASNEGGGVYNSNTSVTSVTLNNSIVGANTVGSSPSSTAADADIHGPITANYCLIQNTTTDASIAGSNNLLGVSPLLGTLGNYGGTTQTMPLLSGSPAIDAGQNSLIPSGVTTDQRGSGFVRIWGKSVDLGAYEYQIAVPTVTTISPTSGPTAGGTTVTISGANLLNATAVKFGATAVTTFVSDTAGQIVVASPAGSAGAVDVTVTTASGTSATSSADQFTYVAAAQAPAVTVVSPTSGFAAGGTTVTITGTGFTGVTAVKFGSTAATAFTVHSDTQITTTSPAGSTGTVDVTVTTAGGTSATSSADQFTYVAAVQAPAVTAVNPTSGSTAGGTTVTITGTAFTGVAAVKFGNTTATAFTVHSATQITTTSPAGSAGSVDVTVTTANGTSAISSFDRFTYVAAAPPTIVTAISPNSGSTAGGTIITITGTNLQNATAVKFGTTAVTRFAGNTGNQIVVTSPAGVAGVVDVTVVASSGTSATSTADHFTYVVVPTVKAVSPTSDSAAGGTTVTITGTDFTDVTAVKFGDTAATAFTIHSDTQITAISPAGTGMVDVTVTAATGSSLALPTDQFSYIGALAVTGISPSSQRVTGGVEVTITGAGFTGATAVNFGHTAAMRFTVASDTQIVAMVPAGANGSVDVTVVTARGASAIVPADQFTYYEPGCTMVGLYNPTESVFYLRNSNTAGCANNVIVYGAPGNSIPLVGDWNGDGTQTIGLYDRTTGTFYLSNSNASHYADISFLFGPANSADIPIVGDWTGDGVQTVGLYDPRTSTFYLRNSNSTGFADITFMYGVANGGLVPIAGDWNGDGMDTIGLYSSATSMFYLRNSNSGGYANTSFMFGPAQSNGSKALVPLAGCWNSYREDTIGLYSSTTSTFYLQTMTARGIVSTVVVYGAPNSGLTPIVGNWMGDGLRELAAQQVVDSPDTTALTQAQLTPIVNEAIAQWSSHGLSTAEVLKLRQAQFVITDLPGSCLGKTEENVIHLDTNAAGNGWFIDPTPATNEEFSVQTGSSQLRAVDPQALDHIDLLTVVEHELGHIAGLADLKAATDDMMDGVLGVGVRRAVSPVDAALAS
jgi:hypothetical protein